MQVFKERKVILKTRWEARRDYLKLKGDIPLYLIAVFLLTLFVHPVLAGGVFALLLEKLEEFYGEYFRNREKRDAYRRLLSPRMSPKALITVGYEIDPAELENHLYMLHLLDSKDQRAIRYLQAMDYRSRNGESYRQIGISKNQLTTHFWIIGTTGAGKTSLIMQVAKMLLEVGGGMIFVDGKADVKMFFKLYNLAKAAGREQDVYLINFLPVEGFKEHTNTFNPFANMTGAEIVEFLAALKGQPTGDMVHWVGRGKALLSPIASYLYYRKKYNGENFTISVLYSYISDLDKFFFLVGSTYLMLKDMEERLRKSSLYSLYEKAKLVKGTVNEQFPYVDALNYYFDTYAPHERHLLREAGFNHGQISLLWHVYDLASTYIRQLASVLWNNIEKQVQAYVDRYGYEGVLELGVEEFFRRWQSVKKEEQQTPQLMTALQQHSYAQQQWTDIFSVLLQYANVFGSLEPEVDMLDVIKNQKFLYVLLPPLKQSETTTSLLGKLILTAIRKAVSVALGEGVEGMDDFQREVLKKRITPVPLGVVVLDEYGAYPIPGIDTLLAQVRSINTSVILSTQDYTSARAEGKDENSVRRAWANTQKIIFRNKDDETLKMLEQLIAEKEVLQESYIMVEDYYTHERAEKSTTRKKLFDPKLLQGFKNGAGILITDEDIVIFQSYWADAEEAKKVYLNHSSQYRSG